MKTLLFLAIIAIAHTASAQSHKEAILELGPPTHVEQTCPDTIMRTYHNESIWIWYVNDEPVREIHLIHSLIYRRETKRLARYPEIIPGWYEVKTGVICRTLIWLDNKAYECRIIYKPHNIRIHANPQSK